MLAPPLRRLAGGLALLALVLWPALVAAGHVKAPAAGELLAHVEALTAPAMEGRGSGTPGGDLAARYLVDRLAAAGVAPGGDAGAYEQRFVLGSTRSAGRDAAFERTGPTPERFALGRDWQPHGGAPAGAVEGEVIRAGHGITSADGRHDDYAGLDVRDRIVVVEDGAPAGLTGARASRLEKLIVARHRGARALLVASDSLPAVDATAAPFALPSAAITRATAAALPSGSRVRLVIDVERADRTAANILGVVRGTDPSLAGETLVLGAHYDHLGRSGTAVYPGADDNASGTAVVVGLARALAAAGGLPRTVVVALFSGEELGLLGSSHYVRQPATPGDRTVVMLNLDMVGRLARGGLQVGGVGSGAGLDGVVRAAAKAVGVDVKVAGHPNGPSDHASFYAAGVPVLFFHTGSHPDYHAPTDTAEKIDAAGLARVAALAAETLERLASAPRPTFVQVAPERSRGGGPSAGAFLGVTAGGRGGDGVRLGAVLPGTAAARAGMRDGDILVRIGEVTVDSFDDLRKVLGDRRPGDTVSVVYLRAGDDHTVSTTLGSRP
jgi:hypothetical protein